MVATSSTDVIASLDRNGLFIGALHSRRLSNSKLVMGIGTTAGLAGLDIILSEPENGVVVQRETGLGWPAGQSEMARLIREHDWAATPLGPIQGWPQCLRTLVDLTLASGTMMCLMWGPSAHLLYNEAYARSLDGDHPGALGRSAFEVWPDMSGHFGAPFQHALAGEEAAVRDQYLPARPPARAREGWFDLTYTPVRDEGGQVAGVLVSLVETSERVMAERHRREAEATLRASEARFRAIVETATDYAIFTTDPEGRIETWPAGAQQVFGWTAEEAVGQCVNMTFTPEDRAEGVPEKERQEARDKGQAPDVRWHMRKDGSRVFIDGMTRPLVEPDGRRQGFVKVGQDVTERRATEEALRASEARFRQFGEATGDVLWIRNAETLAFEYVSPAFEDVYGHSLEEVLGSNDVRRWAELVLPEDRELALDHLRRVREGEHVLHAFRILRADGEIRWIRDTGFPIHDEQGRVKWVAGIGHDATEEVELNDRLRVLVTELQHRSRNLVTVVRGLTERTLSTSETLDDFRPRIRSRIEALGRVNSLLSRIEDGARVTFDELLRTELQAHGVVEGGDENARICLSGPQGVPLRSATVQTFALALHELATNALKHGALSKPDGRLEVCWSLVPGKGNERRLRVEWRESGVEVAGSDGQAGGLEIDGTPVPRRQGYGRALIERALPYQLKAETDYKLTPEGAHCTIVVPVSSTLDVAFSSHGEPGT